VLAFVMEGTGVGGVRDVPDPVASAGQLLVRPDYSGLCGTDVHMFHEGTLTRPDALPVVMGHEFTGVVEEIGPGALDRRPYPEDRPLQVGDRVAVEPMLPCGRCLRCLRGRPNLCLDWSHLGILVDGAWAELVAVPGSRAVRIPESIDPVESGLLEPLACAVNFVLDRGEVAPGDAVLVLGAGPIGLLSAQVAVAAGAGSVVVSEPNPLRRELASSVGATAVVDPVAGLPDLRELTGGREVDVVVEATGVPAAVASAITLAPSGSRVVLAGLGGSSAVPLDANLLVQKELEVRGGFASRWAFARAIDLLARERVRTAPLVSSVRHWSEALEAMKAMTGDPATCKILFRH
jgi:2-desacetyl-2-hydroxyethyl bacteriochlorophyllide A dehydrogenase